jgi:EAL domain-containing protein (putative c-di-GMP-specific phosphodiesterase class I)
MSCLYVETESETTWFGKALREDRFETWFQPIVDTRVENEDTRRQAVRAGGEPRLIGHHCSLRLFDGRLYGDEEILEAARTRSDLMFDEHARRVAIAAAAAQRGRGPWFISFAPSSIRTPESCLKTTLSAVEKSGMRPRDIVFEAAESDLACEPARSLDIRDFMGSRGFGFAVGDAGIGADSLRTVCHLRPDYIKLDKSLVRSVERPAHAATIRKLVEIGDSAQAGVIAKGVDRKRTMENLWLLGVRYMQGYLFGSPKPAD